MESSESFSTSQSPAYPSSGRSLVQNGDSHHLAEVISQQQPTTGHMSLSMSLSISSSSSNSSVANPAPSAAVVPDNSKHRSLSAQTSGNSTTSSELPPHPNPNLTSTRHDSSLIPSNNCSNPLNLLRSSSLPASSSDDASTTSNGHHPRQKSAPAQHSSLQVDTSSMIQSATTSTTIASLSLSNQVSSNKSTNGLSQQPILSTKQPTSGQHSSSAHHASVSQSQPTTTSTVLPEATVTLTTAENGHFNPQKQQQQQPKQQQQQQHPPLSVSSAPPPPETTTKAVTCSGASSVVTITPSDAVSEASTTAMSIASSTIPAATASIATAPVIGGESREIVQKKGRFTLLKPASTQATTGAPSPSPTVQSAPATIPPTNNVLAATKPSVVPANPTPSIPSSSADTAPTIVGTKKGRFTVMHQDPSPTPTAPLTNPSPVSLVVPTTVQATTNHERTLSQTSSNGSLVSSLTHPGESAIIASTAAAAAGATAVAAPVPTVKKKGRFTVLSNVANTSSATSTTAAVPVPESAIGTTSAPPPPPTVAVPIMTHHPPSHNTPVVPLPTITKETVVPSSAQPPQQNSAASTPSVVAEISTTHPATQATQPKPQVHHPSIHYTPIPIPRPGVIPQHQQAQSSVEALQTHHPAGIHPPPTAPLSESPNVVYVYANPAAWQAASGTTFSATAPVASSVAPLPSVDSTKMMTSGTSVDGITATKTSSSVVTSKSGPRGGKELPQPQQQQHSTRSGIRSTAVGSAGQRPGLGNLFYFLDQMRLEAIDADRTIRNLQTEIRQLRDKNKELETKARDAERKLEEEKSLRAESEAKFKLAKKKLREMKAAEQEHGTSDRSKFLSQMSSSYDKLELDSIALAASLSGECRDDGVNRRRPSGDHSVFASDSGVVAQSDTYSTQSSPVYSRRTESNVTPPRTFVPGRAESRSPDLTSMTPIASAKSSPAAATVDMQVEPGRYSAGNSPQGSQNSRLLPFAGKLPALPSNTSPPGTAGSGNAARAGGSATVRSAADRPPLGASSSGHGRDATLMQLSAAHAVARSDATVLNTTARSLASEFDPLRPMSAQDHPATALSQPSHSGDLPISTSNPAFVHSQPIHVLSTIENESSSAFTGHHPTQREMAQPQLGEHEMQEHFPLQQPTLGEASPYTDGSNVTNFQKVFLVPQAIATLPPEMSPAGASGPIWFAVQYPMAQSSTPLPRDWESSSRLPTSTCASATSGPSSQVDQRHSIPNLATDPFDELVLRTGNGPSHTSRGSASRAT